MHSAQSIMTSFAEVTNVTFCSFPDDVLQRYIATGDPMDKAGAYGIQSKGAFLVDTLEGSYTNVVGLPLSQLIATLLGHGILSIP